VVDFASEAVIVITIRIKQGAAFALVVNGVVDDGEA
jgi:hypothetical protein